LATRTCHDKGGGKGGDWVNLRKQQRKNADTPNRGGGNKVKKKNFGNIWEGSVI